MTNEESPKTWDPIPFVFRFAHRLPNIPHQILRYDAARQISQVLVDGHWVDSRLALSEPLTATRLTEVRMETTDDE